MVFTNPMDYKNAQQKLSELRDSLDKVLGGKTEGPSREDAEEALKTAKDGARRAKKTLLGRIKELPVVDKITQLGAAGTVAVSTAAVTQTNIAVDETEIFVASVANDVVHERLRFPPVINNFVDFSALNSWGQEVMQAKVAEVQAEVAKVEAKVAPVQVKETKTKTATESQATEETESQEPQAQEESTNNSKEDGGSTEETEQDAEEVDSEEVKSEETQESQQEEAEPVPEEDIEKSVDEIDPIKPHSDVQSDEPEQPLTTSDDLPVVSPEQPRQV